MQSDEELDCWLLKQLGLSLRSNFGVNFECLVHTVLDVEGKGAAECKSARPRSLPRLCEMILACDFFGAKTIFVDR
jgi:hypothetical protein